MKVDALGFAHENLLRPADTEVDKVCVQTIIWIECWYNSLLRSIGSQFIPGILWLPLAIHWLSSSFMQIRLLDGVKNILQSV